MMLTKKLTFAALSLVLGALSFNLSAQEVSTTSVAVTETETFRPHWFLQAQGGIGYTFGESEGVKDMISPAAAINAGYRFNPLFALRFGVSGWQGKGCWVDPRQDYKFNYLQGNVDAMLSLTNLFCGYKPNRVIDSYLFLGAGLPVGFHNNEAVALDSKGYELLNLWTGKKVFWAGRAGLGINFNLSRVFALNIEVNGNMLPDSFNSKKGSTFDWQLNGLVGVVFKFGATKKVPVAVAAETVVEEVVEPEPQPVQETKPAPVEKPAPAPAPAPEPVSYDIFFTINSSHIVSKEQVKINELSKYLKDNADTKVVVTGYADKATGSSSYNMILSKRRAQAVADALVKTGISADRIKVEALGDTQQPFTENSKNRVAIAIAK